MATGCGRGPVRENRPRMRCYHCQSECHKGAFSCPVCHAVLPLVTPPAAPEPLATPEPPEPEPAYDAAPLELAYSTRSEAELAVVVSLLDGEGIRSLVQKPSDTVTGFLPMVGLSPMEVFVREPDLELALSILAPPPPPDTGVVPATAPLRTGQEVAPPFVPDEI